MLSSKFRTFVMLNLDDAKLIQMDLLYKHKYSIWIKIIIY